VHAPINNSCLKLILKMQYGGRQLFENNIPYFRNCLTDFDNIWQDDAYNHYEPDRQPKN